jgi:methanogenic corrinoid protein MtbC1
MARGQPAELADVALQGRHDDAWRICIRHLRAGLSHADLVEDVLAPAQAEIGRRWLHATVTVGDEHRATAVIDGVLARLELRSGRGARGPLVVCASPEGDWHTLAPRMVASVLHASGVTALYVGSVPSAADLSAFLAEQGEVAALALSCSVVSALPAAARCVEAAAHSGVPVVCGGLAFAAAPSAAVAIGATAVRSALDIVDVLSALRARPSSSAVDHRAVLRLEVAHAELIDAVESSLTAGRSAAERTVVRMTVEHLVGVLGTVALLDDAEPFRVEAAWTRNFLAARNAGVTVEALVDELRRVVTAAVELPAAALDCLGAGLHGGPPPPG